MKDPDDLFCNTPWVANLEVEYKFNPIGMDEPAPRFSYQVRGMYEQQARQIQVFEEGRKMPVWDSGWVKESRTLQIEYTGEPLKPFTRYAWRVRAEGVDGRKTSWSNAAKTLFDLEDSAFFETGFLGTAWEHSKWVGFWEGLRCNQSPQVFFQDFNLLPKKRIARARLYVTALGCYRAEVNDEIVSVPLAPGWTAYRKRVQYQGYDITDLLKRNKKNTLWLTLASGWFDGHQAAGRWTNGLGHFGKSEAFRAEIRIVYFDGTVQTIGTNAAETKTLIRGTELRYSDIFDGELCLAWYTRKHALEIDEPRPVRELPPPEADIVWSSGPDVAVIDYFQPVTITKRCTGTYIVDFGQNLTGVELLRLKNTVKGSTITIRHGEMLNEDGSLYIENLRTARATSTYVCDTAESATYRPTFTFYGFRYLEISGWPGKLTEENVTALALSSDMPETANFRCDNELVNQLSENVYWGLRSNLLDVPTDCPQRDERFGWTGDTQVICNAATYYLKAPDFYTKWLADLNADQNPTGEYPIASPTPSPYGQHGEDEPFTAIHAQIPGWTDAAIIVPWQMYRKYGDTRLLKKYFDQMDKYLQRIIEKTNGSYISEPPAFGDWLNLDDPTTLPFLGTAYLAGMLALLARIAKVIDREQDEKRLLAQAQAAKAAFADRFIDPKKGLKETSQTACLIALHFDLLPERWIGPTLLALKNNIAKHNTHLATGFLGTPLLLPILTKYGETDLAYKLLCQKTYPGWLYPVTQGATTMWERWNSYTKEKGFGPVGMNSFNHYAYGAVAEWFLETICGISPIEDDPAAAGFKRFRLAPKFGKLLKEAGGFFQAPNGDIFSRWMEVIDERGRRTISWDFVVPPNTTAEVTLPGKMIEKDSIQEHRMIPQNDGTFLAKPGSYTLVFRS